MSLFRTEIQPQSSHRKISYQDELLFVGSCFSDNIGGLFSEHKFKTIINPFGILFNPESIAECFELAIENKVFTIKDLIKNGSIWSNFSFHSNFSDIDSEKVLININNATTNLNQSLYNIDWLFITLGTAWVYEYKNNGKVVANCHKVPNNEFNKRLLGVDEVVERFQFVINKIRSINSDVNIVFTVSPVRHIKDGVVENQRSKSVLHIAIDELQKIDNRLIYFPSYELLMDDLRDYRFYKDDMLHPNNQAIKYVWEKLIQTFCNEETRNKMNEVEKLVAASNHKPFNINSEEHQKFIRTQLNLIDKMLDIDFKKEKQLFESQLL